MFVFCFFWLLKLQIEFIDKQYFKNTILIIKKVINKYFLVGYENIYLCFPLNNTKE